MRIEQLLELLNSDTLRIDILSTNFSEIDPKDRKILYRRLIERRNKIVRQMVKGMSKSPC